MGTLSSAEKLHAAAAKKAKEAAAKRLAAQKKRDLDRETQLNKARFITSYIRDEAQKARKMKIVNPIAGSLVKAKKEMKALKARHAADVRAVQLATAFSAEEAEKNGGQKTADGTAADAKLRAADLNVTQSMALSHLSKHEFLDAEAYFHKQKRIYASLQAKLKAKRAGIVKKVIKKAKVKAPKVWDARVKQIKLQLKHRASAHKKAPKREPKTVHAM